jgi:acyl transferase domain-containing protein
MITAIDEHREEVSISIGHMKTSMQKLQSETKSQFVSLTQQLESQIQRIQLSTDTTRDAIQSSPALSPENLTDLKCSIVAELTQIIHSAIASVMPQLIRQHLDATLGPAIRQALAHLQLSPNTNTPTKQIGDHQPTGMSPPRKMARANDADAMDHALTPESPSTPTKEPPDRSNLPSSPCS